MLTEKKRGKKICVDNEKKDKKEFFARGDLNYTEKDLNFTYVVSLVVDFDVTEEGKTTGI